MEFELISDAQLLERAIHHHNAGKLNEAEAMYFQILSREPNNSEVMHLMGKVAVQNGKLDVAIEWISRAIAVSQAEPVYHDTLAQVYRRIGRPEQTAAHLRRVVELDPDSIDALNKLAYAERDLGHFDEAIAALMSATRLRPDYAEVRNNLGVCLSDVGRRDEAIREFGRAVTLKPDYVDALHNLAKTLTAVGRNDEAIAALAQAVRIDPNNAKLHHSLGLVFAATKQTEEAIRSWRRTLALAPNFAEAHSDLGNALRIIGQVDEAIEMCLRALRLRPKNAFAAVNLGRALIEKGRDDEAVRRYREALLEEPDNAEAHWALADALLRKGDFDEGWREFEWRWRLKNPSPRQNYVQPEWDGSNLSGRIILLYCEQGFGDVIQFVRYVPVIAKLGASVIVPAPSQLSRLLETVPGGARIITTGPLPEFDLQNSLLSLPRVCDTRLDSIPVNIPYLSADPLLVSQLKAKIGCTDARLKVGLAWAGRAVHGNDRNRSISLEKFSSLSGVNGVALFNLQKGEPSCQAADPPAGMKLNDLMADVHDFADTAALIVNLDLVVTVDTAVAHLAGALGKPVWVLLPFTADWRWLRDRDDSPWYPTMRLFRQSKPGDWAGPIFRITNALESLTAATRK